MGAKNGPVGWNGSLSFFLKYLHIKPKKCLMHAVFFVRGINNPLWLLLFFFKRLLDSEGTQSQYLYIYIWDLYIGPPVSICSALLKQQSLAQSANWPQEALPDTFHLYNISIRTLKGRRGDRLSLSLSLSVFAAHALCCPAVPPKKKQHKKRQLALCQCTSFLSHPLIWATVGSFRCGHLQIRASCRFFSSPLWWRFCRPL